MQPKDSFLFTLFRFYIEYIAYFYITLNEPSGYKSYQRINEYFSNLLIVRIYNTIESYSNFADIILKISLPLYIIVLNKFL